MLILNFAHPLTSDNLAAIERLAESKIERVIEINVHCDLAKPVTEQAHVLVDSVAMSSAEWQATRVILNPPSLGSLAAVVIAELHGRMGYFPAVLSLRRLEESIAPRFDVAEIINLQAVRDAARRGR